MTYDNVILQLSTRLLVYSLLCSVCALVHAIADVGYGIMEGNVGKQEESLFNQTKIDNIFISVQA